MIAQLFLEILLEPKGRNHIMSNHERKKVVFSTFTVMKEVAGELTQ